MDGKTRARLLELGTEMVRTRLDIVDNEARVALGKTTLADQEAEWGRLLGEYRQTPVDPSSADPKAVATVKRFNASLFGSGDDPRILYGDRFAPPRQYDPAADDRMTSPGESPVGDATVTFPTTLNPSPEADVVAAMAKSAEESAARHRKALSRIPADGDGEDPPLPSWDDDEPATPDPAAQEKAIRDERARERAVMVAAYERAQADRISDGRGLAVSLAAEDHGEHVAAFDEETEEMVKLATRSPGAKDGAK